MDNILSGYAADMPYETNFPLFIFGRFLYYLKNTHSLVLFAENNGLTRQQASSSGIFNLIQSMQLASASAEQNATIQKCEHTALTRFKKLMSSIGYDVMLEAEKSRFDRVRRDVMTIDNIIETTFVESIKYQAKRQIRNNAKPLFPITQVENDHKEHTDEMKVAMTNMYAKYIQDMHKIQHVIITGVKDTYQATQTGYIKIYGEFIACAVEAYPSLAQFL